MLEWLDVAEFVLRMRREDVPLRPLDDDHPALDVGWLELFASDPGRLSADGSARVGVAVWVSDGRMSAALPLLELRGTGAEYWYPRILFWCAPFDAIIQVATQNETLRAWSRSLGALTASLIGPDLAIVGLWPGLPRSVLLVKGGARRAGEELLSALRRHAQEHRLWLTLPLIPPGSTLAELCAGAGIPTSPTFYEARVSLGASGLDAQSADVNARVRRRITLDRRRFEAARTMRPFRASDGEAVERLWRSFASRHVGADPPFSRQLVMCLASREHVDVQVVVDEVDHVRGLRVLLVRGERAWLYKIVCQPRSPAADYFWLLCGEAYGCLGRVGVRELWLGIGSSTAKTRRGAALTAVHTASLLPATPRGLVARGLLALLSRWLLPHAARLDSSKRAGKKITSASDG